jgi:hypothetical protein
MKTLIAAALVLASTFASAADITVFGGKYDHDTHYGIDYAADSLYTNGRFSIVPEFGVSRLVRDGDHTWIVDAVPEFTYAFKHMYFDAGVGAAVVHDKTIGGRDISTHFQFSDNAGFGYKLDSGIKIGYRYTHFSNADIKTPNPGLETQQVYVSFPLK